MSHYNSAHNSILDFVYRHWRFSAIPWTTIRRWSKQTPFSSTFVRFVNRLECGRGMVSKEWTRAAQSTVSWKMTFHCTSAQSSMMWSVLPCASQVRCSSLWQPGCIGIQSPRRRKRRRRVIRCRTFPLSPSLRLAKRTILWWENCLIVETTWDLHSQFL